MTEKNLELWDSVSRVPPEHLKGFSRAGGFKGTAIKPMWSFKTMTERFGPVGQGWGMSKPEFTVQPARDEILVYCTVSVWVGKPENAAFGVGGDKVLGSFSSGLKTDDEAFKKAYTDALTNALKMFGVGADIHMGLWDGNKYVDETPEAKPNTAPLPPIHNDTKTNTRDTFIALCKEVNNMASLDALRNWKSTPENIARMESLNGDLADNFRITFQDKVKELKEKMAL